MLTALHCALRTCDSNLQIFPRHLDSNLRSSPVVHNYITLGYSVTEAMPRFLRLNFLRPVRSVEILQNAS